MQVIQTRRRKKRRGTSSPRFGPSSLALEIGLVRQALAEAKEVKVEKPKSAQA